MGITVVSSMAPAAATANASAAATNASATPDTLPGGFAALLGSQLSLVIANAPQRASSPGTPRESEKSDEPQISGESADQTLSLLMAVPAITPPLQPLQPAHLNTTISQDAANATNTTTTSRDDAHQLAEVSSEAPKTNATNLMQESSETFKAALNFARDIKPEAQTANIAAGNGGELATQASAALAATSVVNKVHATVPAVEIRTPLHSPSWSQDFSDKVTWMAKNDQQSAQININPPQLGPLQITLQINGDQASAVFASPHTEVRQAIESSLSQLRDMLATAGINLGQTDIGANMSRQNDNMPFQTANGNRGTDETAILPDIGTANQGASSAPIQRGRGLVDLFA